MIDSLWRLALCVVYRVQLVYWFICRPTGRSAHIAVWWDGRLLLVRNSYRSLVAMPAGGLKHGEAPGEGARRELREEVGLSVTVAQLRPAGVFVSRQQYKEDRAHVFELELETPPTVVADGREVLSAEFVRPDDLPPRPCCEILRCYLDGRQS